MTIVRRFYSVVSRVDIMISPKKNGMKLAIWLNILSHPFSLEMQERDSLLNRYETYSYLSVYLAHRINLILNMPILMC